MKLAEVATLLETKVETPERDGMYSLDVSLQGVQDDSRKVCRGELFVAIRGLQVDGHDFVEAAIRRGAAALVVERKLDANIPQLVVADASHALGILAAHFAGHPGDSLTTIGITGTNGKTTTSYVIEAILLAARKRPGVLGTVSYRWNGEETPAPYTTPTPLVLQEAFSTMKGKGCDTALLEVSSAALHMDRLVGTSFQVAAFSNLTQDHLDVHQTMGEYRDAKARLFRDHLAPGAVAVINVDDPAGAFMVRAAKGARVLRVSSRAETEADIRVLSHKSSIDGISAIIETPRGLLSVHSPALIGHYNVDNIALAVGVGEALSLPQEAIARGISEMSGVPGRVERVSNSAGMNIFVDYAHTPDALINVLAALRPLTKARLLCVFGCGGDRDADKRALMGAAVAGAADLAFVTSDNPRTESPQGILDMITPSIPDAFLVDIDRRVAIAAAIAEATPKDVVLIAGKGHEDYQIFGTEKVYFDDREEAAAACALRVSYSVDDVLLATGGRCTAQGAASSFSRVVIDGRNASPGDLYVAIRGERFDGHQFCEQAIAGGATGLLVARGRAPSGCALTTIEVDDPGVALGDIARMHRRRWGGKVIGITGSAGKTTTKDLLAAALRGSGRVHCALGSNNNETGVPLTLLGARPHHDFCVVEMGMRGPGEIAYLADIAEPDIAVVTNAGSAHVGRLGSSDAIARAKGEIYGSARDKRIGIFPTNDSRLAGLSKVCLKALRFGEKTGDESRPGELLLVSYEPQGRGGSLLAIEWEGERVDIALPLVGRHNALNACCAVLAAVVAGATLQDAAKNICGVTAPSMRGEIRSIGGRNVLVDCYNANPASMEAALATLCDLRQGGVGTCAVLGDMLELGDRAKEEHTRLGERAAKLGISLVAMGDYRENLIAGAQSVRGVACAALDPAAAAQRALECTSSGDWILLKASRGMKLERVAESMHTLVLAKLNK